MLKKTPILNWKAVPFFRLLLPFLLGIYGATELGSAHPLPKYLLLILSPLLLYIAQKSIAFQHRYHFGVLVFICMGLLGYVTVHLKVSTNDLGYFGNFLKKENQIVGTIREYADTYEHFKVIIEVEGMDSIEQDIRISGKLLVFLKYNVMMDTVKVGDQIYLKGRVLEIRNSKNPYAFDFDKFWFTKNIHHQVFVGEKDWRINNLGKSSSIFSLPRRTADYFHSILKEHIRDSESLSVASALILGKKNLLDERTKIAYSNTGAMHVLAVSGLHVGLIYLGMSFLLNLLKIRGKVWKHSKTIILVLTVWFFAFLTGASPSVLRASTMFSFIILGDFFDHNSNIYNTLCVSAFYLLLINPLMLLEVGFQLSYLAVLGIIYFQPKIFRNFYFDNRFIDKIWELTSVAVAAQISTLPISLYYFHQFPVYFWVSGLVVIPAATLILGSGIALFLSASLTPFLVFLPKFILNTVLWITNTFIFNLSEIPGAVVKRVWIEWWQMLGLYGIIILLATAINTQKWKWIKYASWCFFFYCISYSFIWLRKHNDSGLIIYQAKKNTLIDWYDSTTLWTIKSHKMSSRDEDFASRNWRMERGFEGHINFDSEFHLADYCWDYKYNLLRFKDLKLLIVDKDTITKYTHKLKVDYILLDDNTIAPLDTIRHYYDADKWVLGSNNSYYNLKKYKNFCDTTFQKYHTIKEDGPLILKIK